MNKLPKIVFMNNKFVSEDKAVVSVTTHALHYGTGVFEGIRAYYNEKNNELIIFKMQEHYERMLSSCKLLFISIPYDLKKLSEITIKLLQKNFEKTDIYIRPLAFKSDPAIGNFNIENVGSSFAIYCVPLGRHYKESKGLRVNISSWTRVSDNAIPPRGKITGAYANTCLAKTESSLLGFDEGLMLDGNGHVVEGSAENVFMIKDGVVITPPVWDDILPGITRDTIIKICQNELSLPVLERSIDRSEIYGADEVFLTGTGAEVNSVSEIDFRKIGNGQSGKIAVKITEIYQKIVHGEYPGYGKYLTKVSSK